MPRQLDPRIADILRKYGEDPNDTRGVVWDCHGTWVVYHKAIERMAAKAGMTFDAPTIIRAERDEAVILVSGEFESRRDWDIGECLLNVNYRTSPKQAAYVWAMATKRARDRLVLKLIGLHGLLYSEEEADEFKTGRPAPAEPAEPAEPPAPTAAATNNRVMQQAIETGQAVDHEDGHVTAESALARSLEEIRRKVDSHKRPDTLQALMLSEDTQAVLRAIGFEEAMELRTYAWRRIREMQEAMELRTYAWRRIKKLRESPSVAAEA